LEWASPLFSSCGAASERENIGLANDGIDAHPVHCKQPRETAREMSSSVGYGAVDWNDDYTVF